uniref:Secreted protein n=1 Tax=Glycine max TaxID=3847 RepID=C6SX52_SOYBN|nr:unknown [Glycine max]
MPKECLMALAMIIVMTLPRMPPAQYNRTVLLCPVEYPKPHDRAQTLAGDSVPALWVMNGNSFVGGAVTVSSSHHDSLLHSQIK